MYEKQMNNKVIKKWMKEAIESKTYKHYDHLHLDFADKNFKKKTFAWVQGAYEFLEVSEKILDQLKGPFYLALCFSLKTRKEKTDFNIDSDKALFEDLDSTPPLI